MRRAPSQRTKDFQAKMQRNHMKNEFISEQQRVSEENVGLKAKVETLADEREGYRQHFLAAFEQAKTKSERVAELELRIAHSDDDVYRLKGDLNESEKRVTEIERYVERVDAQSVPLKNFYEDHQDEAFGVERVRELEAQLKVTNDAVMWSQDKRQESTDKIAELEGDVARLEGMYTRGPITEMGRVSHCAISGPGLVCEQCAQRVTKVISIGRPGSDNPKGMYVCGECIDVMANNGGVHAGLKAKIEDLEGDVARLEVIVRDYNKE